MSKADKIILAGDLGTTSTKVLAVSQQGQVLGSHSIGYPLYTPKPGYAEQDPDEILEAFQTAAAAVMRQGGWQAEDILCVTFSSANHSLIVLDENGKPLTPSITWADQRSAPQVKRLVESGEGITIYSRTGTPIHPMSPLVKMMWLKEEQPEIFAAGKQFIGIKEYVFYKLFGTAVMDYSIASATGMFNLEKLAWDEEVVAMLGISLDQLPPLAPSTGILTGLNIDAAIRMGLSENTPFVLGAQDGVLANLGIGAIEDGVAAVTIGTSSAVRTCVSKPQFDIDGRLFCYALTEGHWLIGGPSNNGAIAAQWTAERLFPGKPMEEVLPLAAEIPAGSDGLLFLPLLSGERAPFWDAEAKGVMFGLTLAHNEKHMLRAAMEGVMFQIAAICSLMKEKGTELQQIRASGGFARSPIWCQMMADILGVPVQIPEVVESSGLGAAQLGLFAMNNCEGPLYRWDSEQGGAVYEPDQNNHTKYEQLLPIYLNIYSSLKTSMGEITAWQHAQSAQGM